MSGESIPFEPWRQKWVSHSFVESMVAGAFAGFVCDFTLYPLDTLKTRLQSAEGLAGSGGLGSAYRGLGVALAGSVPCSALFFTTYEAAMPVVDEWYTRVVRWSGGDAGRHVELRHCAVNALAAATGELVAATVRTPIEALKQRRQVFSDARHCLWRGWSATLLRDMPFSMVQYPLYHAAKRYMCAVDDPCRAALCGSCTSAIAAALTTPFDVAQTRIMLATGSTPSVFNVLADIARNRGVGALFAGVWPRSAWMGLGGLLFLGSYEHARSFAHQMARQNASGDHLRDDSHHEKSLNKL